MMLSLKSAGAKTTAAALAAAAVCVLSAGAPGVHAAASVSLADAASVNKAIQSIAANLMAYYQPNAQGAIPQNGASDASGVQWYESGILWGAMMEYARVANDGQYSPTVVGALVNASSTTTASFLGPFKQISETLLGRWNDDILWWGLGPLTGAEMYGKDAVMPRGGSYIQLAINTYEEAWQQWDTEACGGGIYWSRNRQAEDNRRTYKSTITNAQHMIMSGRLAILTGNSTFNERGELVYAWLKSSGLVTADWRVLDGGNAPTCRPPNPEELSYKIGTLLGGIGWLYKSTGKEQYQTEAASMLDVALRTFAPNNIFTDPCEAANPTCRANQVSPKGTMIRGLMYLYMTTTSAAIKTKIATAVETSFLAMAAAACDEKWNCGNVWQGAGARVYTDFHTQLNALELANALAIVRAPNGAPSGTQTAPSGTGNTGNTKGSAVAVGAGMTGVAGAVAAALMALLA